ncbi:4Fe-4S binding protein [Hydrogenimonas cancrithermarum]|uniref:(4Fe-4S)-binding protein n=1 Tax=Hydrogenimonas cancrithermarum TaxID=2993563 RepID=A0ABN6WW11_9BACT|nr:4Fe-4S binding protein [Hydrogenimonas cancrithermarum]BDY13048.1 (4Fe-4S)-binding protein [Hydrogenimonas cancrithermarum]
MRNESLTAGDLFKFDYFKCLRSEFAKNECRICIDLCPEGAMVFDRTKLTLDTEVCTACAACVGSCPTEALISETFDPNRFALEFSQQKNPKISCKENVPCLAALSSEHLITIALRKEGEIFCDLAHCEGCSINRDNRILETIETMIDEAERFLQIFESEKRIERVRELPDDAPETGRRGLLKKLVNVANEVNEETTMTELMNLSGEKQPLKRILLKNSLKMAAEKFSEETTVEADFSFVVNKTIDAQTCTNCQECAMFCPTEALSILQDNTGIIFQMGKCIACSICDDVCQPGSIHSDKTFDLVTFTFDRMQLLVKHTLEICEECKVAFPYRGGERVCDRCKDFRANHGDLFTMARDME